MVNYWLCVTTKENWEIVKNKNVWGVSEKNRSLLEKTQVGDCLLFYIKTNQLGGIFRIVSAPFRSEEDFFVSTGESREAFPYCVRLETLVLPSEAKNFQEIVSRLRFVGGNKDAWRSMIRKAMQRVSSFSYEDFRKALENP